MAHFLDFPVIWLTITLNNSVDPRKIVTRISIHPYRSDKQL